MASRVLACCAAVAALVAAATAFPSAGGNSSPKLTDASAALALARRAEASHASKAARSTDHSNAAVAAGRADTPTAARSDPASPSIDQSPVQRFAAPASDVQQPDALAPTSVQAASTGTSRQRMIVGEYNGTTFPDDIDAYTKTVGAKPNVVMWYTDWKHQILYQNQERGIDERGVTPLITWSPSSFDFSMQDAAAGKYDSYIRQQARLVKAWHRTVYIRLFHEMNGTWKPYGIDQTDPASFVHGWRRVVGLFRQEGATNVRWVWSPNIYGFGATESFDRFYPGDAYVNWVGLDGYNSVHWWRSFTRLFKGSYDDLTRLTGKSVLIAEWGCPQDGGDKAAWIANAFQVAESTMPRVKAMVVFDRDKETDYRVNSSSSSLSAYQQAMRTYQRAAT